MLIDIDNDKIKEIMQSFYLLTKIRMAIVDVDCQEIYGYPGIFSEFCTYLRSIPDSCVNCVQSDYQAFEICRKTKNMHIYKCHAGLTEVAYPLYQEGTIIGFLMIGQVTDIQDKNDLQRLIFSLCQNYPLDFEKTKSMIMQLQYKSREELVAAVTIFDMCINYILQKRLISAKHELLIRKIDQYIDSNLSSKICVKDIANLVSVSRSELYNFSSRYLGLGIAEYIRNRRLDMVKTSLTTTNLSCIEIAEKFGYKDVNYLRRIFYEKENVSMKAFRDRSVKK